jgi:hypothetical protein
MNLDSYRVLFLVITLGMSLFVAYPVLNMVLPLHGGTEQFSELWFVDADHGTQSLPFNITADELYTVNVGLGNRMNNSEYYLVRICFRNTTQYLSDINRAGPSSLPSLVELRLFVDSDAVLEAPITFSFQKTSIDSDILHVNGVTINGNECAFSNPITWNTENNGFYLQLFCELWAYDKPMNSFVYTEQTVGLLLNMTGS